jgi:hypothetical protein
MLLQLRFGGPIRIVERLGGILQVVKLTALMRDSRKDKGNGTPDGFLPIGDDALNRHLELFQLCFDFSEQRGQIPLRATE